MVPVFQSCSAPSLEDWSEKGHPAKWHSKRTERSGIQKQKKVLIQSPSDQGGFSQLSMHMCSIINHSLSVHLLCPVKDDEWNGVHAIQYSEFQPHTCLHLSTITYSKHTPHCAWPCSEPKPHCYSILFGWASRLFSFSILKKKWEEKKQKERERKEKQRTNIMNVSRREPHCSRLCHTLLKGNDLW